MPILAYTGCVVSARRLVWLGDSHDRLQDFPKVVRTKLGFALYLAQIGQSHESAKMMTGFRGPVWQVKADDRSGTYRAVYVVSLPSAVYVLHTFQKKSTDAIETRRADLELVQRRLKVAIELDGERSGQ